MTSAGLTRRAPRPSCLLVPSFLYDVTPVFVLGGTALDSAFPSLRSLYLRGASVKDGRTLYRPSGSV
ncbi:hypothetical protein RSOLAG22IIIB_09502 [Rhizoctonia solani]|uniref:Uncharacterized protein n=1 Tax=Rhizoctonia solani TaxID=456999 RepID=A0A0K6FYH6_9AGAM|nr:hypothetical protein RSOLAG22IIIB_09502 [Rhizoctonia solani]